MPSKRATPDTKTERQFWHAKPSIFNGDLLLFRRHGLISLAGRSDYSHSAMAAWWDGDLMCLEVREWHGGRATSLWWQVRKYDGLIDVYRVQASDVQRIGAVRSMRHKCGEPYNYRGVYAAGCVHLLGQADTKDYDDETKRVRPEFCSQATSSAWRVGGKLDIVHHLADKLTEPGDQARSAITDYKFTLLA